MPTYLITVPHLEVEEFLVVAASEADALRKWSEGKHALSPVSTYTPYPGPRVRVALEDEGDVFTKAELALVEAIDESEEGE